MANKTFDDAEKNVDNLKSELHKSLLALARLDGKLLADEIKLKFQNVVDSTPVPNAFKMNNRRKDGSRVDLQDVEFTETPSLVTGTLNDAKDKKIISRANPMAGEVHVFAYGPTLLYYEFGTGTIGSGSYPNDNTMALQKAGWVYNSGSHVRKFKSIVKNWRYQLDEMTFYGSDYTSVKDGYVNSNAKYWLRRNYAIQGIKAQHFIYDTMNEYRNDFKNTRSARFNLTKKSIGVTINQLVNKK